MSFLGKGAAALSGVGVYTIQQAATLARLRLATADRIVGPRPTENTAPQAFPIAIAEVEIEFGEKIVTFLGLMEMWVASQIRDADVPWPVIRLAAYHASRILRTDHPLLDGSFRTERRRIYLSLRQQSGRMPRTAIDLLSKQEVLEDVIERSLSPTIVTRDLAGKISKWFPLGRTVRVVLDPERRFGEPIDPISGIPTASLSEAFHAEGGNVAAASRWFDTDARAIRDAAMFEKWLKRQS